MQFSSVLLSAALTMFGTQNMSAAAGSDYIDLPNCTFTTIYEADIPADLSAQQGGVLKSIDVTEGDVVKADDLLATVDNTLERMSEQVALYRLEMAQEEANNDINVRYARAAADVHEYRFRQVLEAAKNVEDAYTMSELKTYELQWKQFLLQTEQALHEQNLAAKSVKVREAEYELAKHELFRREIKAPRDGMIIKVHPHAGEWVRAGDPIATIVQLDRLRISGPVKYGGVSPADVDGKPVSVIVELAGGNVQEFQGRIDFVSPNLEGGDEFRVRAEVENRMGKDGKHYLLMPRMRATLRIHLR